MSVTRYTVDMDGSYVEVDEITKADYDALLSECQRLRERVGVLEEMLIEKQGTAARQYEIAREMHKSFIYHQGIVNYQERAARLSGLVRRGMGVET